MSSSRQERHVVGCGSGLVVCTVFGQVAVFDGIELATTVERSLGQGKAWLSGSARTFTLAGLCI